MVYLLIGEDSLDKDQKILEIRNKVLSAPDALQFDYEVFHGSHLDPADLKKAVTALPAIANQRFVAIRAAHKLSPLNKEIVLNHIRLSDSRVDLVLDFPIETENSFVKEVTPYAKVFRFGQAQKANVFDMTRAMSARKPVDALKILSDLFQEGVHPLQIMGALIWHWGKTPSSLTKERFQKGLSILQEADLNIKRSRLDPEFAMECAVVKLMEI